MTGIISSLWQEPFPKPENAVHETLEAACNHSRGALCRVFFRADDVAAPSRNFTRLMELFISFQTPLCLAVVPAWLTGPRWGYMKETARSGPWLCCWHQHGFTHRNHQRQGKKSEFGPDRPAWQKEADIRHGRMRLEKIMKDSFFPVFTPPWNRCDRITLEVLENLGYYGISRSSGSRPAASAVCPDFEVQVDLHTRREEKPDQGRAGLLAELKAALSGPECGIMIHHQRMNQTAFDFLQTLLSMLGRDERIELVNFHDLIEGT